MVPIDVGDMEKYFLDAGEVVGRAIHEGRYIEPEVACIAIVKCRDRFEHQQICAIEESHPRPVTVQEWRDMRSVMEYERAALGVQSSDEDAMPGARTAEESHPRPVTVQEWRDT